MSFQGSSQDKMLINVKNYAPFNSEGISDKGTVNHLNKAEGHYLKHQKLHRRLKSGLVLREITPTPGEEIDSKIDHHEISMR